MSMKYVQMSILQREELGTGSTVSPVSCIATGLILNNPTAYALFKRQSTVIFSKL